MLLFLAPDANRLPDLLAAVRMQKAWQQVSDNREAHNLDQHNIRLVESNLRAGADTIAARITETYIWLLVPRQEAKEPLAIDALKVNGRGTLAARATGKSGDDGLLITRFAPTLLRMAMDSVPLWRDGDHVTVAQVWDDFTRYPYLPRLRDSRVVVNAVVDGPQELNAEQDGFGYADAYDDERGRYRGLVLHRAAEAASLSGLIVRYDAAKRQWDEEQEAARRARDGGDGDGEEAGVAGGTGAKRGEDGGATTTTTKVTRFTAWKQLDPVRAGKEATAIADECPRPVHRPPHPGQGHDRDRGRERRGLRRGDTPQRNRERQHPRLRPSRVRVAPGRLSSWASTMSPTGAELSCVVTLRPQVQARHPRNSGGSKPVEPRRRQRSWRARTREKSRQG